tara:strand:- start:1358 stop:2011 length:654 start_codon:yes stop_codon:yes gene_type:complete
MTSDEVIEKGKDKKLKNSNEVDETCKKVRFNLDKNTIKLISPNNKKKKLQNQLTKFITTHKDIESTNNISMVKDAVEFNNSTYGTKIMDNSNFFNSTDHSLTNPQVEFVKKLNKDPIENNDDIFKNQKGYWESQTIDDFVHRTYDNNQVANFNKFREQNSVGQNIATTFDKLSEVENRDLANTFGDSVLRHDDNTIMGNMDNTIYGYSTDCKQSNIN